MFGGAVGIQGLGFVSRVEAFFPGQWRIRILVAGKGLGFRV